MSKVDEIRAKQEALAKELVVAMKHERNDVLKDIKEKIRLFEFTATDFKGMFKSRITQKQVDDFLKRKEEQKNKPKKPTAAKSKT